MIKSFKHKGLKRFFAEPRFSDISGISERMARRLIVVLDALEVIESAAEMDIVGLYFHPLKGNRKGYFSVRLTGNWRVTWKMNGNDVVDTNLEDYH
jgi:proteic killer suppression protein